MKPVSQASFRKSLSTMRTPFGMDDQQNLQVDADGMIVKKCLERFPELQGEEGALLNLLKAFRQITCVDSADGEQIPISELKIRVSDLGLLASSVDEFAVVLNDLTAEKINDILNAEENETNVKRPLAHRLFASFKANHRTEMMSRRKHLQIRDDSLIAFEEVVLVFVELRLPSEEQHETPFFPFDPETNAKQAWDLLIMTLLLYTAFSVPYFLAFGDWAMQYDVQTSSFVPKKIDENSGMYIFDTFLDCLFCFDIAINFCTAYTSRGVYVTSMNQICANYLKGWFWIDFFGSVPFDKIFAVFVSASDPEARDTLQGLRMIRILKAVRAFRFIQKLNELQKRDHFGVVRLLIAVSRATFILVFVAHFLACAFYMIIDHSGQNWLSEYDPTLLDFQEADNNMRYVTAFYWAVTTISTIGYGDILPTSHDERCLAVIAGLLGGVAFAFAMGSITAIISDTSNVNKKFDGMLQNMKQYLVFRIQDKEIQRRALSYFGSCWRDSGRLYQEFDLLHELPDDIQTSIIQAVGREKRGKFFFLAGLDDLVVGDIFVRMIPHYFDENEVIYRALEKGRSMYILDRGSVTLEKINIPSLDGMTKLRKGRKGLRPSEDEIYVASRSPYVKFSNSFFHHENSPRKYEASGIGSDKYSGSNSEREDRSNAEIDNKLEVPSGGAFGEVCLFPDICKYRYETATAKAPTNLFMLTLDLFMELNERHPHFVKMLRDLCELSACVNGVSNATLHRARVSSNASTVGGHRATSNIELSIAKQKHVLMAYHQRSITELPDISNEQTRCVSSFRGWLRSEVTVELPATPEFSHMPFVSFEEPKQKEKGALNGGCDSYRWQRVALGITRTGDIIAIFDSVEDLVKKGPQRLGRLTKICQQACTVTKLAPQDMIAGLRTMGCTFAILPFADVDDNRDQETESLSMSPPLSPLLNPQFQMSPQWNASVSTEPRSLTFGVSAQDCKKLCAEIEGVIDYSMKTSDSLGAHHATTNRMGAFRGPAPKVGAKAKGSRQESSKEDDAALRELLIEIRAMRKKVDSQSSVVKNLQDEIRALRSEERARRDTREQLECSNISKKNTGGAANPQEEQAVLLSANTPRASFIGSFASQIFDRVPILSPRSPTDWGSDSEMKGTNREKRPVLWTTREVGKGGNRVARDLGDDEAPVCAKELEVVDEANHI